jgi:hypothetical protein
MSYTFDVYSGTYITRTISPISDSLSTSGCCWIYPGSLAFTQKPVGVGNDSATPSDMIEVDLTASGELQVIAMRGGWTAWGISSAGSITVSNWHHIGWSIDSGGGVLVYVNGTEYNSQSGSLTSQTNVYNRTVVGGSIVPGGPGTGFIGRVAEFAVWNAILAANDFKGLSYGKSPLDVVRGNLKFYQPLIRNYNEYMNSTSWTEAGDPLPSVSEHCRYIPKWWHSWQVAPTAGGISVTPDPATVATSRANPTYNAQNAILSAVGSFNIDTAKTSGQTQTITGVGFQPKVIILWASGGIATGDSITGGHVNSLVGAATSSTNRFCCTAVVLDNVNPTDATCFQSLSSLIAMYTNTSTLDGQADLNSMTSDGFVLDIDDQFANAYRINYLALGGAALTNASVGRMVYPIATGYSNMTGIGFNPDAIIIADPGQLNIQGRVGLGLATGPSNQGYIEAWQLDNLSFLNTCSTYSYNGEVLSHVAAERFSFTEFLPDGFKLNALEVYDPLYFYYIALKGGSYLVGETNTRTDTNTITCTTGFRPSAILMMSPAYTMSTQNAWDSGVGAMSIGAATSASSRAASGYYYKNAYNPTSTARGNYNTAMYAHIGDDVLVGLMDINTITDTGFTCIMDDTDPSACWVSYLAIGNPIGNANEPEYYPGTTGTSWNVVKWETDAG